ncbi:uncharacterized protein HD556DRAFT_535210 [Suillus plorans]|uniref:Uncharacterized protein n=1 Tax=Suillus plorans TaxID=116603 RepID=A0A9P7DGA3_9AGAM|nr:uncharacterized protein HD556DRAFT_535210 [Suillus plorans]KAG1792992.1 hypothetical protein HD556DRAFT_535210 [Suillus plorans]
MTPPKTPTFLLGVHTIPLWAHPNIACSPRFLFATRHHGNTHSLLVNERKARSDDKVSGDDMEEDLVNTNIHDFCDGLEYSMIIECLPFPNETVQPCFGLQTAATGKFVSNTEPNNTRKRDCKRYILLCPLTLHDIRLILLEYTIYCPVHYH